MSLAKVVALVDEAPWCGTKPPGFHPPRQLAIAGLQPFNRTESEVALNPQPLPPGGVSDAEAYLWQAVRLYQYGQLLTAAEVEGSLAKDLTQTATVIYDDGCGSVPLSVIINWILYHVPPPPPPWLEVISQAVSNILVAQQIKGEFGQQLRSGSMAVIQAQLGTIAAGTARTAG
jgi:hypothetical protein